MTPMLRCLLVVLIAVPLTWLTPAPAHACDCVSPPTAGAARSAEVVFVATLDTGLATQDPPEVFSATATVDRVLKGDVGESVTVTTSRSSCGVLGLDAGTRWLFVEDPQPDGSVDLSSCGSSGPASKRAVRAAEAALGLTSAPTAPTAEPPGDPSDDEPVVWLAALGSVLAIAVGAAAFWYSRRR